MKISEKNRFHKIALTIAVVLASFTFLTHVVYAKNIGTIGKIYFINEVDFLEFIQGRALAMQQNGLLKTLQKNMQNQAVQFRDRPVPVASLSPAHKSRSWLFDPSIVLGADVKTSEGNIIATAGTRVNPLVHISLCKALIFYDADDQKQRQWALLMDKKFKGHVKLILVNGSTLQEEKRLAKQIYFDQSGLLTTRFQIKHIPATVEQEGNALRISEVGL